MNSVGLFRWTKESTDRLVYLWCQEGASASVIGRVLSNEFSYPISRNSVIGKAHRLGLEHPGDGRRIIKAKRSKIPVVKKSLTTKPARNSRKLDHFQLRPSDYPLPTVVAPEPSADDGPPALTDGVQLVDLSLTTCRWPIGDPREESFRFCGASCPIDKPYCNHHARIAYIPSSSKPMQKRNGDHHGMRAVQLAGY